MKNKHKAIVGGLLIALVVGLISRNAPSTQPVADAHTSILEKDFNTLDDSSKVAYLKVYAKTQTDTDKQLSIALKQRFDHPSTVQYDFGSHPSLSRMEVVNVDSGYCIIQGFLKAKDNFGNIRNYEYLLPLIFSDEKFELKDVIINEFIKP